jgi:glycosyltransferase involved in cell wall biosynthesis/ribosomal protein S18 acetylase RimI-like enzyme
MIVHATTNRMRVLHIVGDSRYGGIARIIIGLGRVARANGWQVDVLSTDPDVQQAMRKHSIGVVDLDVIHREIRPFWDLAGLFRLQKFLRRQQYGIVHTHTSKAGFVGRLAAWLAGVPVIVHTVHGFAFHEQSPALTRTAYTGLERLAANWCHRIVSVSEFHERWALELGICAPARIESIPNGITAAGRSNRCDPASLRRQLGAGERDLLILTTARLAADKGLAYLVEAAVLLPRGVPGFRIAIAGDGPVRADLEQLARERGVTDRVVFLGFREDIGDLLAAADVVVLPSLREGLSISLLEAMAAGKAIIATSIGSHRELACQAEMARLVPPANPSALAEAIQQFARDPALMARLAANAQALFEMRYTEDRMLNSYRRLYLNLVEDSIPVRRAALFSNDAPVVRSADLRDLAGIVRIHQKAFSQFFLTRMGPEFLWRYYELVLRYRSGIVMVSESQGTLDGFVCGFANPAEFYRLMWRNRRTFVLPALAALLRHPSMAANVMQGVRRIHNSAAQGSPGSCELSSIAVTPEASGNGLGRRLLEAFLEQSWLNHAQCVYLTTDADGNDTANALYLGIGFQHSRRFLQRKDRWMNEYVFRRAAVNEPVEVNQ